MLTVGRSGSSLVAHIFREHGLWLGPTRPGDEFNPLGYFENSGIKERMKKIHGFDVSGPMPKTIPGWRDIVRDIMKSQGYEGGLWGLKTGVHFWNVWGEFNPTIIKIMRHRDSIVQSYRRYGGVFPEHGQGFIDRGLARLESLPGIEIDTDALVSGRRDQIERSISASGLKYNEQVVDSIVNPEFWHGC
ncbi:MAG: hypothetical protein ACR2OV_15885 [Hyphomicrobiaceae bacterium]